MPPVDRFDAALCFTLAPDIEGGDGCHPKDKGGLTSAGISQKWYDAWCRQQKRPTQDVRTLTEAQRRSYYKSEYWDRAHCGELPIGLDTCVFDAAVNHDPKTAVELLQRALGVQQDGRLGPKTLAAVRQVAPYELIHAFIGVRIGYCLSLVKEDPGQKVFLEGWLARCRKLRSHAWKEVVSDSLG